MARIKNIKNQKFGYFIAIEAILKYIVDNNYVSGDLLPSLKDMSDMLFNGKLKQVRMAVKQLTDEGVLESHRGRGVFVKDVVMAEQMFNKQQQATAAISEHKYEIEMPHILQEMSKITLTMVERQDIYPKIWGEIIDAFNIANHDFQVDINYTTSPNVHMESDLFQIQSFRIQPFLEQEVACNLSGVIDEPEKFHPNLYGEVRKGEKLFGIPITAVTYGIIANEEAYAANQLEIPNSWNSFEDFIVYVKSVSSILKEKNSENKIISNCFTLGYYMALAGKIGTGNVFEKLDFNSQKIMKFLEDFEQVYRDPLCFNRLPENPSINTAGNLLVECTTYSKPLGHIGSVQNFHYLPPAVSSSGYCPVIPHYICVSNRSNEKKKAFQFLNFLSSHQVSQHLVKNGLVTGRTDTGLDPAIVKCFDNGKPEGWKDEQEKNHLQIFNNIFCRWQSGHISLSQAVEMIKRIRSGKNEKYLLDINI